MQENARENKMGVMKIPALLYSISVPIIISMLVQALYNIVDSVFVAMYDNVAGTGALTAAFPVQNLMIALAVGLAVGTSALLSRSLGQKDKEKVDLVAGQGFLLTAFGYLLFLLFGLFFLKPYVTSQVGTGSLLYTYSIDYLSVICICSVGVFLQVVCERLLQATGKSVLSMVVQLSGAVINLILDPIFIFGLGAIPAMGVRGAAIATVVGQCVAAVVGIVLNLACNKEITLRARSFVPNFRLLKEMLVIGIPSVCMQAIGSVMTFSMNKILYSFSVEAMNVFGIYFKLQSFVFMPIFGLTNGMIPIVAYNYGAGRRDRVMGTVKLAAVTAIGYMLLGTLAFQLLPGTLLGFFKASEEMLRVGVPALRTISLSFGLAGLSIICSASCQAFGKSIYSLFVSIGRQLVVLIPAAFLLSLSGEVNAIWYAFPISELMSVTLAVIFFVITVRSAMGRGKDR